MSLIHKDNRPIPAHRLEAHDHGVVLRHGDPHDFLGARDVWVFSHDEQLYMHYDAAGPDGWLCALAVSDDGITWAKRGPTLELGAPGSDDGGTASYGVTFQDGPHWHLFYLGSPNTTPPPDRIPAFPYLTLKARSCAPDGPWVKQPGVVPFRPLAGSYCADTTSPGFILRHGGEYLQFFSAAVEQREQEGATIRRTLGIARTRDLDGPWTLDDAPILPLEEQIENSSIYFEPGTQTWFLFTNHVALDPSSGEEYTDAVWVYWTHDLERWDPAHKAVVLDARNCTWSPRVVGLPSVLPSGDRLLIYYDGRVEGDTSHMGRDIGLCTLELPLDLSRLTPHTP